MKKLFSLAMAIVCSASMWAIEPVDGVYKLSTGTDAKEFADGINDGTIAGNSEVELTQNLDLGSVGNWVTIGTDAHKFTGTFDGKGYRVLNMTIDGSKKEQGFFGVVGAGATIKNVIMDASCKIEGTGEGACLAALIGCCNNDGTITIENCGNEADVKGVKQNNAAFLGCNYGGTKLVFNNCYNTGKISGGWENGAFSGWCGGGATFNNCYNIGEVSDGETWARGNKTMNNCYQTVGSDGGVTATTADKVASGELAFLLNGGNGGEKWYQKLSDPKDAHPVPFASHGKVYANGAQNCDGSDKGTVVYSNEDTGFNRDAHTDVDGFCSVCHKVVPDHLAPVDGYYQIGNATDLRWFASYVMDVEATAKAKLTANIDYTAYSNGFIGIPGLPFKGEFDGQEHTITIAIQNANGVDRTGLFAAINGATIKNLAVEGTATSNAQNCVGGLGGRSDGNSTIENVIVKTAVSYTGSNGDATCGGLFANMEGTAVLKNCAFLGSISTGNSNGNGGLVGWAGGGSNNKYTNCLVAPTAFDETKGDKIARNNPTKTNCHFVASDDTRLASGELCYILNNGGDNWYQTLPADVMPVPFSSHSKVYANASYNCDGTPKGEIVYANVNEEQHDPHTLVGGFCSVCNGMIEYIADYMTPAADGAYEISDNKQMRWFSAMIKDYRNAQSITENVNADAPVNARLMNDIDFEGVKDYMPIGGLWGQGSTRYAGTFDGQFHKIKNLVINGGNETGIFGVIATGAIIKNFTVDASCSINGGAHVGVVGEVWKSLEGDVKIVCVGNEADITGTGNNVGGILGVNMNNGGYAKLYMTNCYSTGAIKGNAENGQLSGWTGDDSSIENCYAIGEIINGDGFGRLGGGSTATNCYSDKELNWGPVKITDAMLASGELCAKLGDKNFRQEIGTDAHPVLSDTKPNVVSAKVSAAGYATYVAGEDVKFNAANLEAYVVSSIDKGYAELADVNEVPAGEAVVLKADEGTYYFNTTTEATAPAANQLVAATEAVTANGTQYVLAMVDDKVGFYRATEGTIAKGKAYLQSNSNVKAFYFDEEIATGIINANVDADANAAIYNLAGQRVSKMQKGINIVDGKKILK